MSCFGSREGSEGCGESFEGTHSDAECGDVEREELDERAGEAVPDREPPLPELVVDPDSGLGGEGVEGESCGGGFEEAGLRDCLRVREVAENSQALSHDPVAGLEGTQESGTKTEQTQPQVPSPQMRLTSSRSPPSRGPLRSLRSRRARKGLGAIVLEVSWRRPKVRLLCLTCWKRLSVLRLVMSFPRTSLTSPSSNTFAPAGPRRASSAWRRLKAIWAALRKGGAEFGASEERVCWSYLRWLMRALSVALWKGREVKYPLQ